MTEKTQSELLTEATELLQQAKAIVDGICPKPEADEPKKGSFLHLVSARIDAALRFAEEHDRAAKVDEEDAKESKEAKAEKGEQE